MNIAKLQSFLNKLSISGDSDMAELVRTTLETAPYVPNEINDNVVLSGTTAATTTSYLAYGVNNVSSATNNNCAIRLPYPPQKGKQVIVINNSAVPITIYPSVTGGSINNVVNGFAVVPNDGKAYTFYCYENPLPGGWSWNPPAIAQYDSGEILLSGITTSTRYLIASSTAFITSNTAFTADARWAYDGRNEPFLYPGSTSLDVAPHTKVGPTGSATRVKIYTNFVPNYTVGQGVNIGGQWQFMQGCAVNYYDKASGDYFPLQSGGSSAGTFCSGSDAVSQGVISGTPSVAVNRCSQDIGDPGTGFVICNLTSTFFQGTKIGDTYLGDYTYEGNLYEKWFTRMVTLMITPQQFPVPQNFKIRFFIEYN
jgi:hypothetical protein